MKNKNIVYGLLAVLMASLVSLAGTAAGNGSGSGSGSGGDGGGDECWIPEGCGYVPDVQGPDDGDAGVCVIGVPSPCNAPEYWYDFQQIQDEIPDSVTVPGEVADIYTDARDTTVIDVSELPHMHIHTGGKEISEVPEIQLPDEPVENMLYVQAIDDCNKGPC